MSSNAAIPAAPVLVPRPVGRPGPISLFAIVVYLALIAWGFVGHLLTEHHGLVMTDMRNPGMGGAGWGLGIMMYVYLVGLGFASVTTVALIHFGRMHVLEPVARMAELLTLCCLAVAAIFVVLDLGRPFVGLWNLPAYAKPMSPFFGTFTLVVAGELFASAVYFYLDGRADAAKMAKAGPRPFRWFYRLWAAGWKDRRIERRRHHRAGFLLALVILPLIVIAYSTLGFVFGIQGGRPGWYSALQAPGFVVLAFASGVGALILIAAAMRKSYGMEEQIDLKAFRLLGNFLCVATGVQLYFMAVEDLTMTYASSKAEAALAHELIFGDFAALFWFTLACFVATFAITFWQFVTRRVHLGWLFTAGLLVNVGALLRRYLIVVPSQTHGTLLHYEAEGGYVPSVWELGAAFGLCALGALGFLLFMHVFPIVPMSLSLEGDEETARHEVAGRWWFRRALAAAVLAFGLVVALVGLGLSARVGTLPYDDPLLPFSPMIFIAGLMICFLAAVCYELFPPSRPAEEASAEGGS